MGQDDDPVGEIDRLVDVVRDEEDRDPELVAHLEHQVLEVAARLRVDGRERLVHEQDRGLVRERARDRDALLHAARELPWVVVDEAREADGLERLLDEPRPLRPRELLVAQGQEHVVAHGRPRHQRAVVLLEDDRHLLGRRGHPLSVQDDLAARRAHEACDALEQRGLAASRRADHAHELPLGDRERDAPQRVGDLAPGAVRLCDVPDLEHPVPYCGVAALHPRCQASIRRSASR